MEYFYCYDKSLMKFLRYDCQINFICCGKHLTTENVFWQFERNEKLGKYVEEYGLKR